MSSFILLNKVMIITYSTYQPVETTGTNIKLNIV